MILECNLAVFISQISGNRYRSCIKFRIKIRFSHTKRNDIVHLAYNIKKFSDSGRLKPQNFIGNYIFHGVTSILSSLLFFVKIVP